MRAEIFAIFANFGLFRQSWLENAGNYWFLLKSTRMCHILAIFHVKFSIFIPWFLKVYAREKIFFPKIRENLCRDFRGFLTSRKFVYLRALDIPKNQLSNFASKPCSKYPLWYLAQNSVYRVSFNDFVRLQSTKTN